MVYLFLFSPVCPVVWWSVVSVGGMEVLQRLGWAVPPPPRPASPEKILGDEHWRRWEQRNKVPYVSAKILNTKLLV